MGANTTMIYPGAVAPFGATFITADGTAAKAIFTAGVNGARIDSISFASNDNAAHDVGLWVNVPVNSGGTGVDTLIGTISVSALAGQNSGAAAKQALADANLALPVYDAFGNRVIYLPPNAILKATMVVAVTAAKTVYVAGLAASY